MPVSAKEILFYEFILEGGHQKGKMTKMTGQLSWQNTVTRISVARHSCRPLGGHQEASKAAARCVFLVAQQEEQMPTV